jgi:regulator of replication initiation timing
VTRPAGGSAVALTAARRRDSARRRQRVLHALERLTAAGEEISVAAVARAAGVDRSFLYRHHDLRAQVLARAAAPQPAPASAKVSHASLLADLANLRSHNDRLRRQVAKLERRLSEVLGEEVVRASGLGLGQPDADEAEQLRQRVARLGQETLDLRQQLVERTEELDAARMANRELMAKLNRPAPSRPQR